MKSFTALLFVGTIAFAYGMTDEQMEMMKKIAVGCMAETGVSEENALKAKEGIFDSDPKIPDFLFCMFNKGGFMNDAGEYQEDIIKTCLTEKYGADVASQVAKDCTVFQGDKLEKAMQMGKCFHSKKSDM